MILNVIDVEATCWENTPPEDQRSEIIEIGVCEVNLDSGRLGRSQSILVRPQQSEVSDFCTELTGLTPQEVSTGITLKEACALLETEFKTRRRPWSSWGDYDRNKFTAECAEGQIPYPFSRTHTNAKQAFTDLHGLRRPPGMAAALRIAGLHLEGRHHRGMDDAANIARLIALMPERINRGDH